MNNVRLLIGILAFSASLWGCRTVGNHSVRSGALEPPILLSESYGEPRIGAPEQDPVPALGYPAPPLDGITEITLERTGCLGTCPAYQVSFRSDGTAKYWGGEYADRRGKFEAVARERLNRLVAWGRALGIFELSPTYSFVTVDAPGYYVAFVRDGKQTILFDPGGAGPIPLYAFELMIDSLVTDLEWHAVKRATP